MNALDAVHFPLKDYQMVRDYDYIIIIWPKGNVDVISSGSPALPVKPRPNLLAKYLSQPIIRTLKNNNNKKVCYMQEGPSWFFNDYNIVDQFNWYNIVVDSDIIFCHNISDTRFYDGLFPNKDIKVMPSLMIENLISDLECHPDNKVIIGGNFAKWYGGFQSYMIADEFEAEKWIPTMHNKRQYEDQIEDLHHLPYMN